MQTATLKKNITDFKLLEEGEYCQLINGEIIMSPSPSTAHQRVSRRIFEQILKCLEKNNMGEAFYAPVDVFFDDENVFEPDILFVSKERSGIIHDDGIHGAPDIIIEILSVTSGYHDTKIKKRVYEKYGVKEYWIIDPLDSEVTGFKNSGGKFVEIFNGSAQFTIQLLNLEIKLDS
ncbi:MAG: Uma2 family endonuclease [Bacteroidetes bacterium]|nr:Uma2 family endonuclease [Bacteroidota bacterium]